MCFQILSIKYRPANIDPKLFVQYIVQIYCNLLMKCQKSTFNYVFGDLQVSLEWQPVKKLTRIKLLSPLIAPIRRLNSLFEEVHLNIFNF